MTAKIKQQQIETVRFSLQITEADFFHEYLKEDEKNTPIKCQIKSTLEIEIFGEKIKKEIRNTVFINPEEPIYKKILLHSKHIVIV